MARQRPGNESQPEITGEAERAPRLNPEIEKRLNAHIDANKSDHEYYGRLVKEKPDYAVRVLMLKDLRRHEGDMRMIERQLPQAKEFFAKQTPEVQQRINERLKGVNPYYGDKAFVNEVIAEMGRQNRRQLMQPVTTGMRMGAEAPAAGVGV
jgi:hypothetical protein